MIACANCSSAQLGVSQHCSHCGALLKAETPASTPPPVAGKAPSGWVNRSRWRAMALPGLGVLVTLAFAAGVWAYTRYEAPAPDVPERLSCNRGEISPVDWEAGEFHLDFSLPAMLMTKSKQVSSGGRTWLDGQDRIITRTKVADLSTRRVHNLTEEAVIRVKPLKSVSKEAIRVAISGDGGPAAMWTCLTRGSSGSLPITPAAAPSQPAHADRGPALDYAQSVAAGFRRRMLSGPACEQYANMMDNVANSGQAENVRTMIIEQYVGAATRVGCIR